MGSARSADWGQKKGDAAGFRTSTRPGTRRREASRVPFFVWRRRTEQGRGEWSASAVAVTQQSSSSICARRLARDREVSQFGHMQDGDAGDLLILSRVFRTCGANYQISATHHD